MSEGRKLFRIGISGSYGGLNLGDEAILQSIVTQLRQSLPVEIVVFSRNPDDTLRRHAVDRSLAVRTLSKEEVAPEIERLDLFILGGGGILFDPEAKAFLREVSLALEKNVPVMVYAIGAGPLEEPTTLKLVRQTLNRVAAVTVRERSARQVLEDAGVEREILVTADPALLMEPEPLPDETLKREGLDGDRRLVGFSVREPGAAAPDIDQDSYHALLANAADYIVERLEADVVFVPMERSVLDVQHSHAVVAQMKRPQRATVLKGEYTAGQLLSLVGHFEFAVGMRLHFLVFAALQRVPFVALPYAPKVAGFLEALKTDTPPLKEVNAGRLIAYVDRAWDVRRRIRNRIGQLIPELQERARETNRIALRLLTGEHPDEPKTPASEALV
jgi:polysaccharide pyruvyl transferase CsaB